MRNYFFIAPSLPHLVLGEEPELDFKTACRRVMINLCKEDLDKIAVLRRAVDLSNIRYLYANQPLDPHGNLGEKELDEALLVKDDLPPYVFAFLEQFESTEEAMRHFFGLLSTYYKEEIPMASGVLKDILILQREMRLVLAALRAKKASRDIVDELQFEDFTDPLVAHILAQKDMDDYEPPQEYHDLKRLLQECGDDPWEQFKVALKYEFDLIEEMSGYPLFSIDWIVGYMARLMLAEKWIRLDEKVGAKIADKYKTG